MDKIKELIIKYKEILLYLIFGGLTTLLSTAIFYVFTEVLPLGQTTLVANILANGCGIAFAYVTNRNFVFENKATGGKNVLKEMGKFVSGRLFTVALDLAIVYLAVDVLNGNSLLWKLISTVLVVILNYIISKLIVFVTKK